MKKIFQLFLAFALVFAVSACTSKKVENQADDTTAEMTGDEFAEGEMSEEDFAGDGDSTDFVEGSEAPVDENAAPAEGSAEIAQATEGLGDEAGASEPAETGDLAADTEGLSESADGSASADAAPTDSSDMEGLAATEETPADTSTPTDFGPTDSGASDFGTPAESETTTDTSYADAGASSSGSFEEPAPAPAMVPLRKIEATPWTQGGVLLNAVYVARAGDNFDTVSQKIYGSGDKVSELRKVNPTIARREMKVGDKIYYNSPRRPADNTQLITFYEDNGLVPETYVSQPGDNIRVVAKNLLGHDNSWKEIWATNFEVESKGDLPEGTRLRYWAGEASAAPIMAQTPPPAAEPPAMDSPQMEQPPQMEAPPMEDQAAAGTVMNEMPPPPTDQNAGQMPPPPIEESLPPEPMVAEAPPAPIDSGMAVSESTDPLSAFFGSEDQTTSLMIGALFLIAAAALFIIIKKRKARKNIDFQTATHTHIE